jgi:GNAT superfamily N-acetyltransferase
LGQGLSLCNPEPLGLQHRLEGFDCGKPALNDWLLRHARQAQGSGSAKTFVVADDDRVAGYFSLTVGQIDTLDAPERIRKGMGQYPVPVVILARLAVSQQDQGRGIGFGLLQDAIHRTMLIEQAGIRAMLAHPIDEEAAKFYTRFGFIASPLREQQLLLLLKDARRMAARYSRTLFFFNVPARSIRSSITLSASTFW